MFSNRIESLIRAVLIVLAVWAAISQALLTQPAVRPYLTTVDRLEGVPYE